MSFSVEQALRIATANLASRVQSRSVAYTLHASNDGRNVEKTIHGFSMKGLKAEFSALGTAYRYAFITKKGDHNILQFFNRAECRKGKDGVYKFFSMTKKGKKKS